VRTNTGSNLSIGVTALWLTVGLMPVLIAPLVFMYSTAAAQVTLLLGAAAVLALTLHEIRPLLTCPVGRLYIASLLLFAASLCVSGSLSAHRELSFFGTGWRRMGVIPTLAILVCGVFTAADLSIVPQHVKQVLRVVATPGLVIGVYGILQYLGWDPILHADQVRFSDHFRPPGTFGNPTYYANYLIFVVYAGIGLGVGDDKRGWRVVGWMSAAIAIFALILTGTRSALIGLFCGSAVLILLWRPRLNRQAVGLTAFFTLAVIAFILAPLGSKLRSRFDQWIQDPIGGPRLLLWRDTMHMAGAAPLFGTGPDTFATEFPRVQSPELARAYPDFYEESAHNILLDALTAQGGIGFLAFIGISLIGMLSWRRLRNSKTAAIFPSAILASFISHQFTTFVIPTALLYFVFIGAAVAMQEPTQCPPNAGQVVRLQPAAFFVAMIFALTAAQIGFIDTRWRLIQQRLAASETQSASVLYDGINNLHPLESDMDLWFSRALAEAITQKGVDATRDPAWQYVIRANLRACVTSEDRQNAFYNLALLYSATNQLDYMESALRNAMRYAPNWYKPHWLLAQLLSHTGHYSTAQAEARIAVELSGGRHPQVQQAVDSLRWESHQNGAGTKW
jgi:O-antigen ligase